MRKVTNLVVASIAALALAYPVTAADWNSRIGSAAWVERVPGMPIIGDAAMVASAPASWLQVKKDLAALRTASASRLDKSALVAEREMKVVELPISEVALNPPSALAGALDTFEDAMKAVRSAAASDPRISAKLRTQGFTPDDVLALRKQGDALTIYVGPSA